MFQSLLWWIMLGRPGCPWSPAVFWSCFNPSYGGSCSVGVFLWPVPALILARFNPSYGGSCSVGSWFLRLNSTVSCEFQSLLWWIMLGRHEIETAIIFPMTEFQSLLWWIMLGRVHCSWSYH